MKLPQRRATRLPSSEQRITKEKDHSTLRTMMMKERRITMKERTMMMMMMMMMMIMIQIRGR